MKKLLTVQEAATYLRVSRSTVWRWCKDGTLSSAFRIGRTWRIHKAEVEQIMGQSLDEGGDTDRANERSNNENIFSGIGG